MKNLRMSLPLYLKRIASEYEKAVIDSSILLALASKVTPYREISQQIIDYMKMLIIPSTEVLRFTYIALLKKAPINAITRFLYQVLKSPKIVVLETVPELYDIALKILDEDKENPRYLSMYLCIAIAYRFKAVLASFRKSMYRLASKHGIEVIPYSITERSRYDEGGDLGLEEYEDEDRSTS